MKKILLSIVSFTMAIANVNAQLATGEYLIQNVENGQYLGGGHAWGTRASLISKPQFFTVTLNNGKYTLDSHQSNGGDNNYLNSSLFVDQQSADWDIAKVSEGVYTISIDGGYLYAQGLNSEVNNGSDATSTSAQWKFITLDDVVASMANATEENPVDVTAFIINPELKRNYPNSWTVTGFDGTTPVANYMFGNGESWANCSGSEASSNGFKTVQTITLAKAGKYTLSAQGLYVQDASRNESLPYLFAGDKMSKFLIRRNGETDIVSAYASFINNTYSLTPIEIVTTTDNKTIEIGFAGSAKYMHAYFGELELKYYGSVSDEYVLNSVIESMDNVLTQARAYINKFNKEPFDYSLLEDLKAFVAAGTKIDRKSKEAMEELTEELSTSLSLTKESVSAYKNVKAYIEKAENLDEAGKAAFADIKDAYSAGEIENVEDVANAYLSAVKAQNTPNTDMTEAMPTTWEGQTNIYQGTYPERYSDSSFPEGKVIYQHIDGLTPGEYEVEFIAVASLADWSGQIGYGNDIAQVYVNDDAYGIEVFHQTSCDPTSFVRNYIATVGEDGVLEYGIQNIAEGGCWYVAQARSLKYVGVAGTTTAIEDVKASSTVAAGKFVDNSQVVIVKNGAKYNVNGVRK